MSDNSPKSSTVSAETGAVLSLDEFIAHSQAVADTMALEDAERKAQQAAEDEQAALALLERAWEVLGPRAAPMLKPMFAFQSASRKRTGDITAICEGTLNGLPTCLKVSGMSGGQTVSITLFVPLLSISDWQYVKSFPMQPDDEIGLAYWLTNQKTHAQHFLAKRAEETERLRQEAEAWLARYAAGEYGDVWLESLLAKEYEKRVPGTMARVAELRPARQARIETSKRLAALTNAAKQAVSDACRARQAERDQVAINNRALLDNFKAAHPDVFGPIALWHVEYAALAIDETGEHIATLYHAWSLLAYPNDLGYWRILRRPGEITWTRLNNVVAVTERPQVTLDEVGAHLRWIEGANTSVSLNPTLPAETVDWWKVTLEALLTPLPDYVDANSAERAYMLEHAADHDLTSSDVANHLEIPF